MVFGFFTKHDFFILHYYYSAGYIHPMNYAPSSSCIVLCCGLIVVCFVHISLRLLPWLWESMSVIEATLKNMVDKSNDIMVNKHMHISWDVLYYLGGQFAYQVCWTEYMKYMYINMIYISCTCSPYSSPNRCYCLDLFEFYGLSFVETVAVNVCTLLLRDIIPSINHIHCLCLIAVAFGLTWVMNEMLIWEW